MFVLFVSAFFCVKKLKVLFLWTPPWLCFRWSTAGPQETYLRRKLEEAEALGRQMAATSCAQRVARDGEERRVVAREEAAARQAIEVAQMV